MVLRSLRSLVLRLRYRRRWQDNGSNWIQPGLSHFTLGLGGEGPGA